VLERFVGVWDRDIGMFMWVGRGEGSLRGELEEIGRFWEMVEGKVLHLEVDVFK